MTASDRARSTDKKGLLAVARCVDDARTPRVCRDQIMQIAREHLNSVFIRDNSYTLWEYRLRAKLTPNQREHGKKIGTLQRRELCANTCYR